MKIWTSTLQGDDKIIACVNETICKASPKTGEVDNYVFELKTNQQTAKGFFTIPFSYISAINMQEGKNYLEIIFRGDTEHLKIQDEQTKQEVFSYFKENLKSATVVDTKETKLQAGKKPLIALVVVLIIFIWALIIAVGMEQGNEYDVTGQHYGSVAGIILVLANLGVVRLSLIFGTLALIALYTMIKRMRNPVVKKVLIIRR